MSRGSSQLINFPQLVRNINYLMVLSCRLMFINTPKFVYPMEPLPQKRQKVLFSWNQKLFTMYNKILIYFLMVLSWLYKFVNLCHCDIFKPMIVWILTPLEQEFGKSTRHLSRTVAILPGTKKKPKLISIVFTNACLIYIGEIRVLI